MHLREVAGLTAPDGTIRLARGDEAGGAATAVCRLVAGIYATETFGSLHVLRRRIHTTAAMNAFDAAVIKVAAKRCVFSARFDVDDAAPVRDVSGVTLGDPAADRAEVLGGVGARFTERAALRACRALAGEVPLEPERFASPRPIAALVVDRAGALLGAAVNNNAVNRLRHAELNLVFNSFADRPIPAGATVYTSLSPCRMCAALLARVAEDGARLRVVSLALDPGRYGRQSSVAVREAAEGEVLEGSR